ncbi:MAG: outer membrane protein assembly factor BamB [Hylemonella sp.]|nr:outer membrane protein assembly factor BamB [Hylemonella sp.]MDP1936651.1 outer membrane protein assembly factor BamB [Hylemonella sp.]
MLTALVVFLAACSSGPQKPKPAELSPGVDLLGVRQVWISKIGEVSLPLDVRVVDQRVAVAASNGTVAVLDASNGADVWRLSLGSPLSSGVGYDGQRAAVITLGNEVVALEAGREIWRQRLNAVSLTAPLVAGGRVFVLGADRTVSAFDGQSGRRLWQQQRTGEALVLRQAGVLLAVGDTLVVGLSGKLVGLNPLNGSVRWEAAIASPRGVNDIERLVDLVAGVSREGTVICARAFQAAVGCVDAARGTVLWTKPATGATGVRGDRDFIFGAEADGTVVAWRRADGERAWTQEILRYRNLGAPLAAGRSVVVGDGTGLVHFLSREDGSPMARVSTDGTAIVAAPVLAGNTLVVVTRGGGVFGFRPE